MIIGIVLCMVAYLLGSVSFSILISSFFGVKDIRNHGSGNAGSTNVLRTVGKKAAAMTLLCDVLKGVLPVVIAFFVCAEHKLQFMLLSAFSAIIGHIYPVFFGFRGGKGVATSFGAVIAISVATGKFWIPLVLLLVWLIIVIITRYVSLGSVVVFAAYPICVALFLKELSVIDYVWYIAFAVLAGFLGIFKHRKNIARLLSGTESKIGQKAK